MEQPLQEPSGLQVPGSGTNSSVIRSGLLLKLGGKSWARKLQWRQCRLLASGSFEYFEVKKDSSLVLKGELKLKDAECRVEGSGGLMYDMLSKMVGNPAKIPRVPSSKTPPAWEGHGFFYIKPAMLRVKKPGKVYFFICNLKDRELWIDAVRQTIGSLENLRLSAALVAPNNAPPASQLVIPPLRSSPSSPSLVGPSDFAGGDPASAASVSIQVNAPYQQAAGRSSREIAPAIADSYMQARAQFGPASSSSHTAFATLRSARSVQEQDQEDTSEPNMVSTYGGYSAPDNHLQADGQTEIQKAQFNSFFQSPTRQVVRNPEKVTAVCAFDQQQLDAFVVSLGFPYTAQHLQGIPGASLIEISIEDLVERGVDLDEAKRLRAALRDYLSV